MNGIQRKGAVLGFDATPANTMNDLPSVLHALHVIHDAHSSNEERRSATVHLDKTKSQPNAPSHGYTLARDKTQPPVARHYGLSMLEYAISYQWEDFSEEETITIRNWVVSLAQEITDDEPLYLRNKIAQLVTVIAERSWGIEWADFDEFLCSLWQSSYSHQLAVLHILETLSDEVFGKDDSAAGLRGAELGKLCVEIFTPARIMDEVFTSRQTSTEFRCGQDGWLQRLLDTLQRYLRGNLQDPAQSRACALSALAVMRSSMSWMVLYAVSASNCVELLCQCLTLQDEPLQMASLEVLHSLYHRTNFQARDMKMAVCPLLSSDGVSLLRRTYTSLCVNIEDVDDTRYTMLKKLTEVICALGMFFEHSPWLLNSDECDPTEFFKLLVEVLQNPSLVVSIPVLYLWTKLLACEPIGDSTAVTAHVGILLQLCSRGLTKYEMLPSDSTNPTYLFLMEDFETMPERHAFVGNYRRFCTSVIEQIVRKSPFEALEHLLEQADAMIQSVQREDQNSSDQSLEGYSYALSSIDSQSAVLPTALKAFLRWLVSEEGRGKQVENELRTLQDGLGRWCTRILQTRYRDPRIENRVLTLAVVVAVSLLPSTSDAGIEICKLILSAPVVETSGSTPYDEAMKDLQSSRPRELQRLATYFGDKFLTVYDDLNSSIDRILQTQDVDQRVKLDYRSFLFTVILHATNIDDNEQATRLTDMAEPIMSWWESQEVTESVESFASFCHFLGLDEFAEYSLNLRASNVQDWSSCDLDDRGVALREKIQNSVEKFPLQATRSLLFASTDRTRAGSKTFLLVRRLWQENMPKILPKILRLVEHAHAFNNLDSWSSYPEEIRGIIHRTVQDRVWQNGISSESRDDFYARIRGTKATLEGLASVARGAVRSVRELCMWILHSFTYFGESLYGHYDLPEPLARALYTDAFTLSPHQVNSLLKLSSALIDGCPTEMRAHFLPPLLISFFRMLDKKTSAEWEAIEERKNNDAGTDGLDQEMKAESILRNLTHSAVLMVSNVLSVHTKESQKNSTAEPSLRSLILTSPEVLEPLILFCTHALRMRDGRCCGIITRVLRSIVPEFQGDTDSHAAAATTTTSIDPDTAAQVREFFSTEVLKACITSLHEPYFADMQRELAALIASIVVLYSPKTETPRRVLLSLPLTQKQVDRALGQMRKASSERQMRASVLALLEEVRGVSIYESGKLVKPARKSRSAMQEQFMAVDQDGEGMGAARDKGRGRADSPDLGGVADLMA